LARGPVPSRRPSTGLRRNSRPTARRSTRKTALPANWRNCSAWRSRRIWRSAERFACSRPSSADLLAGLRPVRQEGFQALVGQRMLDQRLQRCGGYGGDIGPDHRNLLDVVHGTNGSCKNLGLEVVIVIDGTDLGNELDPVDAHVVDAADEGRDEGCAGLCGQESLIGREAKRDIDHATLRTQGT